MTVETSRPFSAAEQTFFSILNSEYDKDVPILRLYLALYPAMENQAAKLTLRTLQQRIGSTVRRVNSKLVLHEVKPGKLKGTYRLQSIKED